MLFSYRADGFSNQGGRKILNVPIQTELKNKKYVIGISIIIVTFLVSLNPYILIFTVPILLIGVVLIWFSKASGYINHQYYYVSAEGEKGKIPERADYMFSENVQLSSSEMGVWFTGMGKATAFPAEVFSDYVFLELIVSSKDSLAKYSDFRYIKQGDSLKNEIVRSCR